MSVQSPTHETTSACLLPLVPSSVVPYLADSGPKRTSVTRIRCFVVQVRLQVRLMECLPNVGILR